MFKVKRKGYEPEVTVFDTEFSNGETYFLVYNKADDAWEWYNAKHFTPCVESNNRVFNYEKIK